MISSASVGALGGQKGQPLLRRTSMKWRETGLACRGRMKPAMVSGAPAPACNRAGKLAT